jgi:hypothetical protein
MNKTKKHKYKQVKKVNKNNTTRPPKHIYYKNTKTRTKTKKNTNTNTRKQKGGIKDETKKWSFSSIMNLAKDIKGSTYSGLNDEQAERNEWLKYLISDEWIKQYKEYNITINEYKNKHKQMWTKVLISEIGEEQGKPIIDLEDERRFFKKVGDYFSETFVKPLRDKNPNNYIEQILQDPTVLTKMCKQIMYEPVSTSKKEPECITIITGLINRNFEILQSEIVETEKVLQDIFLEQDAEFDSWIIEEKKNEEEKERKKKELEDEMDKLISDELTKEITTQNWKESLKKFKEFRKGKTRIDFKPEILDFEKKILAESDEMKERFANFKTKFDDKWKSFKNLANILTKLNLSIEMYTNLIKEDELFWRDPSLTYYESNKKIYLENIRICLEEFDTIMNNIVAENDATKTKANVDVTLQKFSKEVKDKLDADLKYNTKIIQMTNLIKDLTFLYTEGANNEKLISENSDNMQYKIYKDIINKLSLNIALDLYTKYLLDIQKREDFNAELDKRIDQIQKDIIQVYYIISDANKKKAVADAETNAKKNEKVKQQEIVLLKIKQRVLEDIIKRRISEDTTREDVSSLTEDEFEAVVEHKESDDASVVSIGTVKGTVNSSSVRSLSSVGPQGTVNSLSSNTSEESVNSSLSSMKGTKGSSVKSNASAATLDSLNTIKTELSSKPNRTRINEIKDKLKDISKGLKAVKTDEKGTNLFSKFASPSDHDELDEITNVINSSGLPPPPPEKPTKLTSITKTMDNLLSFLSKSKKETETNPSYSEPTDNPMILQQIQVGLIEKQDMKMRQIARLEHNLRQLNSELKIGYEKYKDNKMRDLFEEELRKEKYIVESDLNIAMRELDNLIQQGKSIKASPRVLEDDKKIKEFVRKKERMLKNQ